MSILVDKLKNNRNLTNKEFKMLLETDEYDKELQEEALKVRERYYGRDVYIRGLIEVSNYCRNDCYYCGIRCSNKKAMRYRLTPSQIMKCCKNGYKLGFRTFVLQGGEDLWFTDERLCQIIKQIKSAYPDCAVTLSLGERSCESYKRLHDAGADRYLLRHESANEEHYKKLHPENLSLKNRKKCLFDIKNAGFATGSGFMVGAPYQTSQTLIEDIRFLQELKPDMIGIGPFLSHRDTPFRDCENGSLKLTLRLLSILRLLFPDVLLPSTTALGTLCEGGREMGLFAGANVLMPNLSPADVRKKYELYDDKICTGIEAAEAIEALSEQFEKIGFRVVCQRGDKASAYEADDNCRQPKPDELT